MMTHRRFQTCLFFLTVLLACTGLLRCAQEIAGGTSDIGNPEKLSGILVDEATVGVGGVAVRLVPTDYNPASGSQHKARAICADSLDYCDTTDSTGSFSFGDIDPGTYNLIATSLPYSYQLYVPGIAIEDTDTALDTVQLTTPGAVLVDIPSQDFVQGGAVVLIGTNIVHPIDTSGPIVLAAPAGVVQVRYVDNTGSIVASAVDTAFVAVVSADTLDHTGVPAQVTTPLLLVDTDTTFVDSPVVAAACCAASNKLHPLQFLFAWDTAGTPWSPDTAVTLRFPMPGRYALVTRARSSVDTTVVSSWSDTVFVHVETAGSLSVLEIVTQPRDTALSAGDTLALRVNAQGNGPLAYQWYHDSGPIDSAQQSLLTIASVSLSDSGNYWVEVSDSTDTLLSDTVRVQVDTIAVPAVLEILTQPRDTALTVGDTLMLQVSALGNDPVGYQWYNEAVPVPGADQNVLTVASVSLSDSGNYWVEVSDSTDTLLSDTVRVQVDTVAVPMVLEILTQPRDTALAVGDTLALHVIAQGNEPLAYQWYHDAVAVPGADQEMLSISSVTQTDSGDYWVAISDSTDTLLSDTVRVQISVPCLPVAIVGHPGDTSVVESTVVSFTVAAAGDSLEYRWQSQPDTASIWSDVGVSTALLSFEAPLSTDGHRYRCIVTGCDGADTSAAAILTVVPIHAVSTPAAPQGVSDGDTGQVYVYASGGSSSSRGEMLAYRFDWGDGRYSVWAADTTASVSWAAADTYHIAAQARSTTDTSIVSGWSVSTAVRIVEPVPDTISTPSAPAGPDSLFVGFGGTFTVTGAVSTTGKELQYRFDWGDSTQSVWSLTNQADKTWNLSGTYDVTARARLSQDTTVTSAWSPAKVVHVGN